MKYVLSSEAALQLDVGDDAAGIASNSERRFAAERVDVEEPADDTVFQREKERQGKERSNAKIVPGQ